MRLIIANSKNWFKIDNKILNKHEIFVISEPTRLKLGFIKKFKPDFIFFPHWSWIVPKEVYENYKCIVFHAAPLPYGRGGSPIQNLILKGFKKTPVCALKMVKKLDAGPIYSKKQLDLKGSLSEILLRLNEIVNNMINELIYFLPKPKEQKGKEYTFKRLNAKDNLLPKDVSLNNIFDRIRMLDDNSYPNAFINYGDFIIELHNARLVKDKIICESKIILQKDYAQK